MFCFSYSLGSTRFFKVAKATHRFVFFLIAYALALPTHTYRVAENVCDDMAIGTRVAGKVLAAPLFLTRND